VLSDNPPKVVQQKLIRKETKESGTTFGLSKQHKI